MPCLWTVASCAGVAWETVNIDGMSPVAPGTNGAAPVGEMSKLGNDC
jgi:hypothetical protein